LLGANHETESTKAKARRLFLVPSSFASPGRQGSSRDRADAWNAGLCDEEWQIVAEKP
jgi:hypothetical protein